MFSNFESLTNQKIKVAIVGCGRIAKSHFNAIRNFSDELELVALCDFNQQVLRSFEPNYDVARYETLERMLDSEKIDLVVLCTPSGLHAGQAIMCAERKLDVVCEKPMATSYKDGLEMVQAFDKANKRLFIVKQNRNNETVQLLKKAVDCGRFGKMHLVQSNVFWTRPQAYYDAGNGWRGTWEFDGGAFMNQASHYVDLLAWLIGPVDYLQALTTTTRKIEAEDSGVVNIKWRNGALGAMAVTMLTYPKNLEGSITILGELGTVTLGGVALNKIETWQFQDVRTEDENIFRNNYEPKSVYGNGHLIYYSDVIKAIRKGEAPRVDGRSGLRSLELLDAISDSAKQRSTVYLPLKVK